jgi:HEAT repeat protein
VPALIDLLAAPPSIAVVAAGALGAIGDQRAFAPLIAQLDHPNASVRQACVAALSSIGHPDLPDRLVTLLRDPSPHVRESAVRLAGYIGMEPLLDQVLLLCRDTDDTVKRSAVDQLPHFADSRARVAVGDALDTDIPGVRAAAARALTHLERDEAFPLLRRAASDRDPWVRYYAARSMGHHRDAAVVPTLTGLALTDSVPPVRIAAIEALAEIGDRDGIAALASLVTDPDSAVACPAMVALGGVTDVGPSGISGGSMDGPLEAALQVQLASSEPSRRGAALQAIASRGDVSALAAVVSLARTEENPELRRQAMDTLGRIGGAEAITALIEMAEDPRAAADVVGVLVRAGEAQLPWLARGLAHPSVGVRCTVVEALGRMRAAAATALLSQALRDDDPAVRHAAAYALTRHDLRATAAS